MDKAGTGIVADSSQPQGHSCTSDRMQIGARDGDVDCLADEVEAVLGHVATLARQKRVVGGGTVTGDDMDLVASSQPVVDQIEVFDGFDVHDGLLVGEVAAHDPVYCIEGVDVVGSVGFPEGNCKPFLGVSIEERE